MLDSLLVTLAIRFAVRQLGKFGEKTDWNKVKADFDARVRDLIPGEFWDDDAVAAVNAALDAVALACQDSGDLQTILDKTSKKDWQGALVALKALLMKLPGTHVVTAALAA